MVPIANGAIAPAPPGSITQSPIKDVTIPKNAIIGAVYSGTDVKLATGDAEIKPGERVIVFCQENAVKKLQKLFIQS